MHALAPILALLLALAACGQARVVKLVWDTPPAAEQVTHWRVWRGIDLLATVASPSAVLDLDDRAAVISVTACNLAGESARASIALPALVWIQHSTDLQTWTNVVQVPHSPKQFIRLEIPPN